MNFTERCQKRISIFWIINIGLKRSSPDLETGAEPYRLELEEEFGKNLVFTKKICEAKRNYLLICCWEIFLKEKHELATKALVSKKLSLGGGGGGSSAIYKKNYCAILRNLGVGALTKYLTIDKFLSICRVIILW